MLKVFTYYDDSVKNTFVKSLTSLSAVFGDELIDLIIISPINLPNKTDAQIRKMFISVTIIQPNLYYSNSKVVDSTKYFSEVLLSYTSYDRLYFDPRLFFVNNFSLPPTTGLFFRQHRGKLSTKLCYLKAGDSINKAFAALRKNWPGITEDDFTFVVVNNYLIPKIISARQVVSGEILSESNISNFTNDAILAIDLTNLPETPNKIKDMIDDMHRRQTLITLSYIKHRKSQKINKTDIGLTAPPTTTITQSPSINVPLECIITRPTQFNPFEPVKKMILSKFKHLPEHNNSLVILGYNVGCDIQLYRRTYPGRKIIVYQLEQLFEYKSQWYDPNSKSAMIRERTANIRRILSECDEIWEYDLDNLNFLISEGFSNVKHIPLVYCEELVRPMIPGKSFDVLFFGSVNEDRAEYLSELAKHFSMIILAPNDDCIKYKDRNFGKFLKPAVFNDDLFAYINKARVVVNIHYYKSNLQEQVRLFELLINNVMVVSQKSRRNYYGDLILEVDTKDQMVNAIAKILKTNSWQNLDIAKRFKTQIYPSLRVGAAYNTFYGFNLIEKSIDSIRQKVDYIVLVHQRTGLNGKTEEPHTDRKITNLLKKKKIDEVVYVDFPNYTNINLLQKFILKKRNIGLEKCIENSCNIIIPMDADECYEMEEFYPELVNMYVDGVDTLYSPIRSYYYDEKHWFLDTYYVPSAIRISPNKKFEQTKSSVLVDPVRKMREGIFRVSNVPMHHYTYLKDSYINKMLKNVASTNPSINENMKKIQSGLENWQEGQDATVFINDLTDHGNVILSKVKLNVIDPNKKLTKIRKKQ